MTLTIGERASPNHDDRGDTPIDVLVLHYTGMESAEASLDRLCSSDAKVSCHYFVDEDGSILRLVDEARRAWHAGVGCWKGAHDVNARSIGVEIQNGGHDFGLPDFPAAQIDAVIALCQDILARRPISADNVIAHSDLAPGRKQDPGEKFPWRSLAEAGIGLWPGAQGAEGDLLSLGDEGDAVIDYQMDLAALGYCLSGEGVFDGPMTEITRAFQQRYYPEAVTGAADAETRARAKALLRLSLTA